MARLDRTWKVEHEGAALATELHRVLEVSHRQAKGLIDAGCVKIAGEPATGHGQRLKAGDEIAVSFDPEATYQVLPRPGKAAEVPFKLLWEDRHLIFVDKPAGLLTVPTEKGREVCLADAITDLYRRRGFKRFNLFIVHRLDRYTSGVLVFGKTPEALYGLKRIFEEHHLHRVYKAILVGELPENAGTLTDKLVERKSLRMAVAQERRGEPPRGAKQAITHYRVLERLPGHTLVEVKLETGRRNQIRVQFADRGFPLLGDPVYGQASELIDRQALHAEVLGFRHPVTEETLTIMTPPPPDFEAVLKTLRTRQRVERAEAGVTGEEGLYKPRITKDRKLARVRRAGRYAEEGQECPSPEERPRRERPGWAPGGPKRPRPSTPREDGATGRSRTQPSGDRPAGPTGGRAARPTGGRPAKPAGSRPARPSTGSKPGPKKPR